MGRTMVRKFGSNNKVSSRNTVKDSPRLTISSINRKDWVSHITASRPKVTHRVPNRS